MLRGRYENTWLALTICTGASLNGNFAQKDWLCNNDLWSHYHLNSPKLFDVQCSKWLYGKDRENIQADFEPFKQVKWIPPLQHPAMSWNGFPLPPSSHERVPVVEADNENTTPYALSARTGCHKLTGVAPHNPARSDSANCIRLPWKFVKQIARAVVPTHLK